MARDRAIEIRRATEADAANWFRMRDRLWPAAATDLRSGSGPESHEGGLRVSHANDHAEEVRAFFRGDRLDPAEVFIARDAHGLAVGFAEASFRSHAAGCEPGRIAYLEGLYVEPSARRTGIGRALVNAVEEWARRERCSELASDADVDDAASHATHRNLGFEQVERVVCFRKPLV